MLKLVSITGPNWKLSHPLVTREEFERECLLEGWYLECEYCSQRFRHSADLVEHLLQCVDKPKC